MTPAQSAARPTDERLPCGERDQDRRRNAPCRSGCGVAAQLDRRPRQAHPTPLPPARSAAMASCAPGRSPRHVLRRPAVSLAAAVEGSSGCVADARYSDGAHRSDRSFTGTAGHPDRRAHPAAFRLQAPGDGRCQRRRGHLARGDRRALEADARERPDVPANRDRFSWPERWPRSTFRSRATGRNGASCEALSTVARGDVPATVGTLPGADVAATGRSSAAPTSTQ
jgi:hypothetical protein